MELSYLFFGITLVYFIFFLWLVWTKTLWSKKRKICFTVLIVIMAICLCYSVYFFRPFAHHGCQDLEQLGQ